VRLFTALIVALLAGGCASLPPGFDAPKPVSRALETPGETRLGAAFDVGGGKWYWDVNAAYGRNKAKQTMFGNINSAHLRQALGPVDDCVGEPGQFGGSCVPFNIFGGAGTITQSMMDFVTFVQHDKSKQSFWDLSANLSGNLVELPGGPLGLAVGMLGTLAYFVIGIAVAAYMVRRYYRTYRGRRVIDGLLLKLPILGMILRKIAVARFCRTILLCDRMGEHCAGS